MKMINERVNAHERGDGIRLEDFASGASHTRAQFVKEYLRPMEGAIDLNDEEIQLISLLDFMISLSPQQLFTLQ